MYVPLCSEIIIIVSCVGFVSHLQRLRMYEMPAVKNKKLVALLLEEALPAGCVVEGVDFRATEDEPAANVSTANTLPSFVQRYEQMAVSEQQERDALIENDRLLIEGFAGSSQSTSAKHDVSDKPLEEKKAPS